MSGQAKEWVEANFPAVRGSQKGLMILAYGAGLDAGLAEAQEYIARAQECMALIAMAQELSSEPRPPR